MKYPSVYDVEITELVEEMRQELKKLHIQGINKKDWHYEVTFMSADMVMRCYAVLHIQNKIHERGFLSRQKQSIL